MTDENLAGSNAPLSAEYVEGYEAKRPAFNPYLNTDRAKAAEWAKGHKQRGVDTYQRGRDASR